MAFHFLSRRRCSENGSLAVLVVRLSRFRTALRHLKTPVLPLLQQPQNERPMLGWNALDARKIA
eukprot:scaffold1554_cov261-Pinguiococcus_pyrenoidosus.AAC.10